MNVRIRPMQDEDITACAAIMAITPLWQRYGVTLESALQRFQVGRQENAVIFVAEIQGKVVGFVWCEEHGAFARSGYIPLIGVHPDYAGTGIGAKLLTHAEAYLRTTSTHVFLLVSDFNVQAQQFYARHGYTRVGALPDYILSGVTEYIYWKRLT